MGFLDSVASVLTGGISDALQGNAPGSALGSDFAQYVMPFANPGAVSGFGVYKGIDEGEWAKAIQYAVDPITEPGIDVLARKTGAELNRAIPGIADYYRPIGTLVGTAVAPGWGTLAGYELTNKMAQGSADQALVGGAIIGATSGIGSLLSSAGSSAPIYTSTDYGAGLAEYGASPAYGNAVAQNSYITDLGTNATDSLANGVTQNTLMNGMDATANLAGGVYSQPLIYGTSQAPTVAANSSLMKPIKENYWTDKVTDVAKKKAKDLIKNQAKKYINEALGGGQAAQPITLSQVQMQAYKPQLNSFQKAENIQSQQEQALQKEATKTSDTQKTLEEQELERQGYLKKYLDYMYNKSNGRTQLLRDYIA